MPLVFVLQTKQNFNFFLFLANTAGMEATITIIFPRVLNFYYSSNLSLIAETSVRRTFVYRDTALDSRTALPPGQKISCSQSKIYWMEPRVDM